MMRKLASLAGLLAISCLIAYVPEAEAGHRHKHRCKPHHHSAADQFNVGEAHHHLNADTVHTLPRDIAWFFPRDNSRWFEKIAIYGTEEVDVRDLHFRHIRVGNAQIRPLGQWKTHYDLNDDGYPDLIFVVLKKRLGIQEGDRFLPITTHTVGSGDESLNVMATAPLGGSAEIAGQIFLAVAKGAAGGAGRTAMSYALSSLGIGGQSSDPAVDLSPITDELANISDQISQLSTELKYSLSLIDTEIKTLDCNNQFNNITDDISQILSWSGTLREWAERPEKGLALPYLTCEDDPDAENCIEAFVQDVLSGTYSGRSAKIRLLAIYTQLTAGGGVSGLIGTCVGAFDLPSGTLDDRTYYANIQDLLHYFNGVQVQGLNVYAEARHYRAWQAYVEDVGELDIEQAPAVCSLAADYTEAKTQCGLVSTMVNRIYARLETQYSLGGAPYSQSSLVIVNGSGYVWPLNLDDFRADAGFTNCPSPLSSAAPCGSVAGTWADTEFLTAGGDPVIYGGTGLVGFDGYEGWEVAGVDQWTDLIATSPHYNGSYTLEDHMRNNMGFALGSSNQIYLTNDIGNLSGWDEHIVGWVDTGYVGNDWEFVGKPPWSADTHELLDSFYSNYDDYRCTAHCCFDGPASYLPSNSQNQSFYVAYQQQGGLGDDGKPCPLFYPRSSSPGMLQSENREQLRYPVLDANSISCGGDLICGGARSNTNTSGVPSMCGADFDAYFEDIIPRPDSFVDEGCD